MKQTKEEINIKISPSFIIRGGWHFGRNKYFVEELKARSRPYRSAIDGKMVANFGWECVNLLFFFSGVEFGNKIKKYKQIFKS